MERVMETKAKLQSMTGFRWKIAVLIFLISFVAYMDRVNLSVATPVIMQEFGFTKMDMGFIQTFKLSFLLAMLLCRFRAGFWQKSSACGKQDLLPFFGGLFLQY